jgi:peptide deformylase
LQRKAKSVPKVTRQVRSLIDDMMKTMYAAPGVRLAAPQVGIRQQVVVVDVGEGPITSLW